jgi:hypothetical protein
LGKLTLMSELMNAETEQTSIMHSGWNSEYLH